MNIYVYIQQMFFKKTFIELLFDNKNFILSPYPCCGVSCDYDVSYVIFRICHLLIQLIILPFQLFQLILLLYLLSFLLLMVILIIIHLRLQLLQQLRRFLQFLHLLLRYLLRVLIQLDKYLILRSLRFYGN